MWDRGKEIIEVDEERGPRNARTIADLAAEADVLFLTGSERHLEGSGLAYRVLSDVNHRLVYVRVRPSYDAMGVTPDFELLVHARTGVLTQIRGHRAGPIFGDLTVAGAGAALFGDGRCARLPVRAGGDRTGWMGRDIALRRSAGDSPDDHRPGGGPVAGHRAALAGAGPF